MQIPDEVRIQFEKTVESLCSRKGLLRPRFTWCDSVVDARCQAFLAVLTGEMRKALTEHDDWDFAPKNVHSAIELLANRSADGIDRADLVEGMDALFTLGGLYRTEPSDQALYSALESEFSSDGDGLVNGSCQFESNVDAVNFHQLDVAVAAQVKNLIAEEVDRLCEPDSYESLALHESLHDQFDEADRHLGMLGPAELVHNEESINHGVWWLFCYGETLWLAGAPDLLHFDEIGMLHCANGPAVVFGECASSCFWKGELVPADWITGDLTKNDIELIKQYATIYTEIAPHRAPEVLADILSSRE